MFTAITCIRKYMTHDIQMNGVFWHTAYMYTYTHTEHWKYLGFR